MSRKQGTLKLSSNIEPLAASPLDARTVVPTLADLTASGAFPYPYVGMIVSVQAEGKAYMLTASDPTVSANWTEIGSGGGDSIQVEELPDPSTVEPGTIYQYVGETTSDYVNGYFYTPQVSGTPVVSNVNLDSASDMDTLLPSPYFTKTTPSSVETVWSVNPGYAAEVTINTSGEPQTINVIAAYSIQGDNFVAFRDDDPNHDLIPVRYMTSLCSLSVTAWQRVDVQPEGNKIFTGTSTAWSQLTTAQKKEYDEAHFTDDFGDLSGLPVDPSDTSNINLWLENGDDPVPSPSDYYSLTEIKTDKAWIDNKPIYRKVITGTYPTIEIDTWAELQVEPHTDIDKVVSLSGVMYAGGSYAISLELFWGTSDNMISAKQAVTAYGGNYYIVIEYTKTTD